MAKGGSSALAPWRDEEWEIWGFPWLIYPRVDRMFEPHSEELSQTFEGISATDDWLPKFLKRCGDVPVYCDPSRMHLFPNAIEYPLKEICSALPYAFLENTIAYQLAMAIWEKVDVIGLWGVHMMGHLEFVWQRPSVTYLVGLAQGRGIEVVLAPGSPLFMSGYEAGRYGPKSNERFVATAA